ncbi:hypothetical protein D3C71_1091520 [compost metagenome]
MISTATALSTACVHEGAGPNSPQPKNVNTAIDNTASTNQYATVSAMRCIGARERCACATNCTICASMLSSPRRSARTTRLPVPLSVAPITASPTAFATGTGSPVSIDSSMEERPSTTVPSTGTFSPGRTRTRSPGCSAAMSRSSSRPSSRSTRAVFGARPSSALIAADVFARARSSINWPSSVSEMIIAAAS